MEKRYYNCFLDTTHFDSSTGILLIVSDNPDYINEDWDVYTKLFGEFEKVFPEFTFEELAEGLAEVNWKDDNKQKILKMEQFIYLVSKRLPNWEFVSEFE